MSWTLLWGPAESPLSGATVGGSWWLAAPAAPSTTLCWEWGSLCPGYKTGPFPVPVPLNSFPHHLQGHPTGWDWPALPQSAPAHTAVTLPSCPCSHSQGCSQQRIPGELKGGSPGQGTVQRCGTRGCSSSSVATCGSLSGAMQHSHGVTPLPSSLGCVPNCRHAGSLQGCQCPAAPHCAQPCFGDSSPTTVSPCSEATTASVGAFSHSPAPTAHTGWATPLRSQVGAGLALGACSSGGDPLRKGAPHVLGSGQRALPCPPSGW